MESIQDGIISAMQACIEEIKRANKIELSSISLNGSFLSRAWDKLITRELEPIWHKVTDKTRSLLEDLKELRALMMLLLRSDCVTFYRRLVDVRASRPHDTLWLLTEATSRLFTMAKQRIFSINRNVESPVKKRRVNDDIISSNSKHYKQLHSLRLNFETNPKWEALLEVIDEISGKCKNDDENKADSSSASSSCRVLIVCRDRVTCYRLQRLLTEGVNSLHEREWMRLLTAHNFEQHPWFCNVLSGTFDMQSLQTPAQIEQYLRMKEYIRLRDKSSSTSSSSSMSPLIIDDDDEVEEVIKLKSESIDLTDDNNITPADSPTEQASSIIKFKRTPVSSVKSKAQVSKSPTRSKKRSNKSLTSLKSKQSVQSTKLNRNKRVTSDGEFQTYLGDSVAGCSNDGELAEILLGHNDTTFEILPDFHIQLHSLDDSIIDLDVIYPSHIILYDPDSNFVRQIEVFKAENEGTPLRVYFLMYADSIEQNSYMSDVKRENESFTSLIQHKAIMVFDNDNDVTEEQQQQMIKMSEDSANSVVINSRKGGKLTSLTPNTRLVIVDMREFRSSLPSALHARGMKIIPRTFEIGDYVLSRDIIVERKSISDLRQSLSNGHLYEQAVSMCRYYKSPILLIEFDQAKPFILATDREVMSDDVQPTSIISKLVLLTIHFPSIRIVWSRSAHATANIFVQLKEGLPEPDAEHPNFINEHVKQINHQPQDILQRLPGVNNSNIFKIMNAVPNLASLCDMTLTQLTSLIGEGNGKLLYQFLNSAISVH